MKSKVDLEDVYLEYPEVLENEDEGKKEDNINTTKMSLEELQKRLEETQSLRL